MFETTRYARVQQAVAPLRREGATVCMSARPTVVGTVEGLFRDKQRMMASAVEEERRLGLFVFAAHRKFGHVGRLWLEATTDPRAGLIGRHGMVDLALPLDASLSLRHVMFVVRRRHERVHIAAVDLESHNGLQVESGERARFIEAEGPLILSASDFVFFCIPTGAPAPWDRDARDAWASLPPRSFSWHAAAGERSARGAPAGWLEVRGEGGEFASALDGAVLRHGLLIGRDARCDVVVHVHTVSRVHAVLLRLDDELLVIDAGSTNGLWRDEQEFWITPLRDGELINLGFDVSITWQAAQ